MAESTLDAGLPMGGGREYTIVPAVSPEVPPRATFDLLKAGVIEDRNEVKRYPKNQTKFTPGRRIEIELPSDMWGDMESAVLCFKAKIKLANGSIPGDFDTLLGTVGAQHTYAFQNGIASIIDRLTLKQTGSIPEEIHEYGLLNRALTEMMLAPEHMNNEGWLQGYGTNMAHRFYQFLPQSSTNSDAIEVQYTLPLWLSGLWRTKYIPFNMMKQWFLEITTIAPEKCIITTHPSASKLTGSPPAIADNEDALTTGSLKFDYELDDVHLYMDVLRPKAWYEEGVWRKLKSGNLQFMFDTWFHQKFQAISTSTTCVLSHMVESVKAAVVVQVPQSAEDGHFGIDRGSFFPLNLKSYQWQVGNFYYPQDPINVLGDSANTQFSGMALMHTLKSLSKFRFDLPAHTQSKIPSMSSFLRYFGKKAYEESNIDSTSPQYGQLINGGRFIESSGSPVALSTSENRFYFRLARVNTEIFSPGTTAISTTSQFNNLVNLPYLLNYAPNSLLRSQNALLGSSRFVIITNFEKDKGFVSGINTKTGNVDIHLKLVYNNSNPAKDTVQVIPGAPDLTQAQVVNIHVWLLYDTVLQVDPDTGAIQIWN